MSFTSELAPSRYRSGVSHSGPSVSCTCTRYWIAFLAVRMPPAGFIPTRRPVSSYTSRIASSMTSCTGSVAAPGSFPVDVLMKSPPAAIASSDARRTLSYVPSSATSRITFRCARPHASLTRTISSKTCAYRPERNAPRSITMSISSAPSATASSTSRSLTSSGAWPDGKYVATAATLTPEAPSRSFATATRFGYTQTAATDGTFGSDGSGRTAFEQSAATLPGVSWPSSVVRSQHRIASSSAQTFASFLIDRFASSAARASTATWSIEPIRGSRCLSGSSNPAGRAGACAIAASVAPEDRPPGRAPIVPRADAAARASSYPLPTRLQEDRHKEDRDERQARRTRAASDGRGVREGRARAGIALDRRAGQLDRPLLLSARLHLRVPDRARRLRGGAPGAGGARRAGDRGQHRQLVGPPRVVRVEPVARERVLPGRRGRGARAGQGVRRASRRRRGGAGDVRRRSRRDRSP